MRRFLPLLALPALLLPLVSCQAVERKSASVKAEADSAASLFEDETDPIPAPPPPVAPSDLFLRIVSLKGVERILSGCPGGPLCEDTLFRTLGGITALRGVIFDERAGDPLLMGAVEPGAPALHLEDLVAALRNAWLAYVHQKGNRITYRHPGVSLDPSPAALKDMRKIARDIARIDAAGGEEALERWKDACRRPYQATVTGLPADCRFAKTLLRADYALKGLANGSEPPGVHGFPGLAELRRIRFQGDPPAAPLPSLTRYWFHPGSQEWEAGEGVVVLKRCPVILMTEEKLGRLRADSAGASAAPADDLAEAFAYGFTRLYGKVAEARPVFRELEGLYRLVAAAKLVRDRFPEGDARSAFPALSGKWKLPAAGAESGLPGLPDLQHFDQARNTPLGMEIDRFWLPSCGGIAVAMEPGKAWIRRVRDPGLAEFRRAAVRQRPSDSAWIWDVQTAPQDYWANLRERMRMQEIGRRFPDLAFFRVRRSGDRKGLDLLDEDDIVLKSGGAQALVDEIASRADARGVQAAFLEGAALPGDLAEALRAAAEALAKARKPKWTLAPVLDRPGWLSVDNPLFNQGADWEPGEPPLARVASGAYRGWQRMTIRFLTTAGGRTVPTALQVMVRSPDIADRLREEAGKAFRTRVFIAYSPLSALMAVIGEFRESLPEEDRRDVRIVEDGEGTLELF